MWVLARARPSRSLMSGSSAGANFLLLHSILLLALAAGLLKLSQRRGTLSRSQTSRIRQVGKGCADQTIDWKILSTVALNDDLMILPLEEVCMRIHHKNSGPFVGQLHSPHHMARDSYPHFSNGDVEIHFGNVDRYILHADILRRLPFFEAALSSRWSIEHEADSISGKAYWVYELRFDQYEPLSLPYRTTSTPPLCTELIGAKSETTKLHAERLTSIEAHQNLLGTLYHLRPTFCHHPPEQARNSLLAFTQVASLYGCKDVGTQHVKEYLSKHRNDILRLCAKDAVGMIQFAMEIRSGWIFEEASTNLLGVDRYDYDAARLTLEEPEVLDLLDRKRKDLKMKLLNSVSALQHLGLPRPTVPSDEEHLRDAVSCFQDWLQGQFHKQRASLHSCPAHTDLYQQIADIDRQLQTKQEQIYKQIMVPRLERVHELRDFLLVVERHVEIMSPRLGRGDELKDYLYVVERYLQAMFRKANDIVQPLLEDRTRLQAGPSGGLKCMTIDGEDLPWIAERMRHDDPLARHRKAFSDDIKV